MPHPLARIVKQLKHESSCTPVRISYPEERRLRRVSKEKAQLVALMVRDGASAPPHHEVHDYPFGGGAKPKMLSIESPSPSSFVSLPRGPSISSPTGKPPGVSPANSDRPGMPALLPGSVLRIMVSNVGTGLPPSIDISPDPFSMSITGAGAIVVGNRMACRSWSRKYASYIFCNAGRCTVIASG